MSDYISSFRQGDTKTIKIDYGIGVDITEWKFWITLRESFETSNITIQSTTVVGDNPLDDALNGLVFLTITSVESETIEPGKYYWDIQVRKGNSEPPIISTILPPISEFKDRIEIVAGLTHVSS